jgi:hypothetical protein
MRALFLLTALSTIHAIHAADARKAIVFQATFDTGLDATVGAGDRRLYSAPAGYKQQANAQPGLTGTSVVHEPTAGRHGKGALRFTKKNDAAVFFKTAGNLPFDAANWSGAVSFWLQLDPAQDLAPGYCDPIQITDKAYNDSAIWVDFTKDERHFRLGVFGVLHQWNPQKIESDKNPAFNNRLVVVKQPPFARNRWTNITITHQALGSGKGTATLYIDGVAQGTTPAIAESFRWDASKGAIRLGVAYVGLFDDLTVFQRALTAAEVRQFVKRK